MARSIRPLIRCFLIHSPSLVITLLLLSLSIKNVFWGQPQQNSNTILNALQFIAQFHATSVCSSLTIIVLSYIQICLKHRTIPLGLVGSGLQLSSVSYIFSSEFWSPVIRAESSKWHVLPLVLLVLIAALIGAAAGPASAILILPRLEWWSQTLKYCDGGSMHAFIHVPGAKLFPTILTDSELPANCSALSPFDPDAVDCPSAGYDEILTALSDLDGLGALNLTMPLASSAHMRTILVRSDQLFSEGDKILQTSATTGPDYLIRGLSWFWEQRIPYTFNQESELLNLAMESPTKLSQLFVRSQCKGFRSEGNGPIYYPADLYDESNEAPPNISTSVLNQIKNFRASPVEFAWHDNQEGDDRFSSAAAFGIPSNASTTISSDGSINTTADAISALFHDIFACSVDARWAPALLWISPNIDPLIHVHIHYQSKEPEYYWLNENTPLMSGEPIYEATTRISINNSWSEYYSQPRQELENQQSIVSSLASSCINGMDFSATDEATVIAMNDRNAQCFSTALSLILTDGIARVHNDKQQIFALASGSTFNVAKSFNPGCKPEARQYGNGSVFELKPPSTGTIVGNPVPPKDYKRSCDTLNSTTVWPINNNFTVADLANASIFTEYDFSRLRLGYGYGLESETVTVACVVLLFHVALAVGHILFVAIYGESQEIKLDSIGDLLRAAWRSVTPDRLNDSTRAKDHWRIGVSVRGKSFISSKVVEVKNSNDQESVSNSEDKFSKASFDDSDLESLKPVRSLTW